MMVGTQNARIQDNSVINNVYNVTQKSQLEISQDSLLSKSSSPRKEQLTDLAKQSYERTI
jgi:hypothetical protein